MSFDRNSAAFVMLLKRARWTTEGEGEKWGKVCVSMALGSEKKQGKGARS